MGREETATHGALVAAIREARRELKATWAEAREDVRWVNAANGTDEMEAAIRDFLRSHRKLVGLGERLKECIARLRSAHKRSGAASGGGRPRKPQSRRRA